METRLQSKKWFMNMLIHLNLDYGGQAMGRNRMNRRCNKYFHEIYPETIDFST